MHKNQLLTLLFFLSCSITFAQTTKGFYVNDFKNIIGDAQKENELLSFAQNEGFNYLLLYNLYYIHNNLFDITDPITSAPLAAFIHKAKTGFGILQIGAVGETANSFVNIDAYNQLQVNAPSQRIDIYNIEFEFWNSSLINSYYCGTYLEELGYTCNKSGAFDFFIGELASVHQLTMQQGLKTEAYIGLPTASQAQLVGANSDRVLVHFYRKSDVYKNGNSIYNYKSYRLADLAPATGSLKVMPVFSSRSYFMGPWLIDHVEPQAFETFMNGQNGYNDATGSWKDHIEVEGYQWYRYTDLAGYMNLASKPSVISPVNGFAVESSSHPENDKAINFSVFPNPASHSINIRSSLSTEAVVQLLDWSGRIVESTSIDANAILRWSTKHLPNGFYWIAMNWDGGSCSQKIVVQH